MSSCVIEVKRHGCAPHPVHVFLLPRTSVTALPGTCWAHDAAAFSPCKGTRVMWRRPNDSQPPVDQVSSSSTSMPIWPLQAQKPTLSFQWISMWTCGDNKERVREQTSLNKQLLLTGVTGSAGVCPSISQVGDRNASHSLDSLKCLFFTFPPHLGPNWTGNQRMSKVP